MPMIEVNHVTKEYRLGELRTVRDALAGLAARIRGREVAARKRLKALDDVDFRVARGEVLGIIGHNGAGKSTLLKLLARITRPTRGAVSVHGRVAPLVEVSAGLVPHLTGRENIFVNGAILGMRKAEIARKFDEIVAFAELEDFIDTPVKRYSSGMVVRLGFAIATTVEAEVLLIDEVLSVGDVAFQRKCFERMESLIRREERTVLFVSHQIRQVERICSRVILLEHGRVVADGRPAEVCNLFIQKSNQRLIDHHARVVRRDIYESPTCRFLGVEVVDQHGLVTNRTECGRPMRIRLRFEALERWERTAFAIGFHTTDFIYLTDNSTFDDLRDFPPGEHTVELTLPAMNLLPGVYSILAWIGHDTQKREFHGEGLVAFEVFSNDYTVTRQRDRGLVAMPGTWRLGGRPSLGAPSHGPRRTGARMASEAGAAGEAVADGPAAQSPANSLPARLP
jgi:ABC-type polysaccharide/polyol phosphate transport system ATPase subunit